MIRGILQDDSKRLAVFRRKIMAAGFEWDDVLTEVENYVTTLSEPITPHRWIADCLRVSDGDPREALFMLFPFQYTESPDDWFVLADALDEPDLRLVPCQL